MDKRQSNSLQLASVKRYSLIGGKEDGLKVVEVDNGVLRFTLNESKALDVMQLWHKGQNVSFVSKNGFSASSLGFDSRFEGGLLYTVGLDSAGVREGFPVHGSFHNIPSKILSITDFDGKIEIKAEINDTALFSKNLKVIRTVSTDFLGDSLTVSDTLINLGTKPENYCLLYHCNFGYPFLDENCSISFDGSTVIPRTDFAKEKIDSVKQFYPPVDNEFERVYFIKNKIPVVKAYSKSVDKTVELSYYGKTLDKMVLWKSNASFDYALGLEPTTTFLDDKFEYSVINPNEKIDFCLTLKIK